MWHLGWELLAVAGLSTLALAWLESMRARDLALDAAARTCQQNGVQLLDQAVSLKRLRLARDENGVMRLRWLYEFEYSDNGDNRHKGSVTLLGRHLESYYLRPRLIQPSDSTLH